jgi:anaerobic dimethyl sulfoxide reductase subunit A
VEREGHAPPAYGHELGGVQEARHLQVQARQAACRLPRPDRKGLPFQTPSGKIEILSTTCSRRRRLDPHAIRLRDPAIPKWIEPWESLNSPKTKEFPFHLISPHPRWRTHSIFNNIPWLRETYEQEVTINASDAKKLGIKTGDTVEVFNDRGKCVVPAYVTERCMPGVAVLHEGAWMDLDENGVDRSGNPDFLTLDEPSPAGAFAYNTVLVRHPQDQSRTSAGLG